MSKISAVGVIGAGQMGGGIAHVFGLAGYRVVLYDIDPGQIDKALETIKHNLGRQVAAGTITEDAKRSAIERIATATKLDDLGDVDLAIEAVTENEDVKRSVYGALCPVLKPDAVLATNTSSISVTRLAAATDRPEKFIGMHFMNPVPMMELIELIRGIATDKADLRHDQRADRRTRQEAGGGGGFPLFHRQPHPVADDQRGGLCPL